MNEDRLKLIFYIIGSIFMFCFCLIPFFYMIIIGLSENVDFLSVQTGFKFTFDNFHSILTVQSLHFVDYLRNSLVVSVTSAIFAVSVAALAAYSITRLPLPGKIFILFFVLAVSMFPQISLVGYLFKILTALGWINTYTGLILPYIAWILPLSLWIIVSYFSQLPKDMDKAALVDGCSHWQILRKVIFPIAAPGVFSTALLAFIFAFNEFMFALMFTTDHQTRTVPVGIALFQGLHGEIPWGNIMAASTITTIPVVVLTLIFQRQIIQGLTRGAVKG